MVHSRRKLSYNQFLHYIIPRTWLQNLQHRFSAEWCNGRQEHFFRVECTLETCFFMYYRCAICESEVSFSIFSPNCSKLLPERGLHKIVYMCMLTGKIFYWLKNFAGPSNDINYNFFTTLKDARYTKKIF